MHFHALAALVSTTLTLFLYNACASPARVPPFTPSSELNSGYDTRSELEPPNRSWKEGSRQNGYFAERSQVNANKAGSSNTPRVATRSNANTNHHRSVRHFACGTDLHGASSHFQHTVERLHAQQLADPAINPAHPINLRKRGGKSSSTSKTKNPPAPAPLFNHSLITVPLYMHVVSAAAQANQTTQKMILAQYDELNAAYAPAGITFALQNVSTTINDLWVTELSPETERAMKSALRRGSYSALNLYFMTETPEYVLGVCALPVVLPAGASPDDYWDDGCIVLAASMPGGPIAGYNMGKTAVHETGHWLGLLHTFEGYSCDGLGDGVADTPAESVSTEGCPKKPVKNSCPLLPGVDPIANYMDYSDDECYTEFSAGQIQRMGEMWDLYRKGR